MLRNKRSSNNPTILFVDDEIDFCKLYEKLFIREGFTFFAAHHANSALEIARQEVLDVIVADIRMPEGSGIELLGKVNQQLRPRPAFLFLSGYDDLSDKEASALGAEGILRKPVEEKQLITAVKKAIDTRTNGMPGQSLDEYLKNVGQNLRAARVKRNLRQIDIQTEIGLTYRHYQDIEAGKANPTLKTIYELSALYQVPLGDLLS